IRDRTVTGVQTCALPIYSRVIVHVVDTASDADVRVVAALAGGTVGRALPLIHSWVVDVPNPALNALANHPLVDRVSLDRPIVGRSEERRVGKECTSRVGQ